MEAAFPAHPGVPISKAVRAGDFVFTSAYGPWHFGPSKIIFDDAGNILDDGTSIQVMPIAEQIDRATIGFISEALAVAGCTLGDVVSRECWLADPRDSVVAYKPPAAWAGRP